MFEIAIQGISAVYLLLIGGLMSTENLRSALIFKVAPVVLGIVLGCNTYLAWAAQ